MSEDQKPQWQPLSKLPLIASRIDAILADTEEQYQKLREARPRPHVLDDYTVGESRSFTVTSTRTSPSTRSK